jgi:hypothetical protein
MFKPAHTTLVVALAALAAMPFLTMQPAEARPWGVNHREARQQGRICQGLKSGQLTGREYRHLENGESRLARREYRFRHDSDPGLQAGERAKLQREENRLSHRIYNQKHDGQMR